MNLISIFAWLNIYIYWYFGEKHIFILNNVLPDFFCRVLQPLLATFCSPSGIINRHYYFIYFKQHEWRDCIFFFVLSWLHSCLPLYFPLKIVLVVGTKLEVTITKMCVESCKENPVTQGTFLVNPSDSYFWFGRPDWLLHLLQLILIQVQNITNIAYIRLIEWKAYHLQSLSTIQRLKGLDHPSISPHEIWHDHSMLSFWICYTNRHNTFKINEEISPNWYQNVVEETEFTNRVPYSS